MKIVADTNIFLAVALNEPEKTSIIAATHGCDISAPDIWPYEIGNAISAMVKRRQVDPDKADVAYSMTQRIPVRLVSTDIADALRLAVQFDIYAYDAYFLATARRLSSPLLTLDRRIKQVGSEIGLDLPEIQA